MGTPFRHRITVTNSFTEEHAVRCTCGKGWPDYAPALVHVKLARRWRYLGFEVWYGDKYYMWEHALTGRHYAWLVERYERETLS
jgi:hypothetical protein